jgi:hypothetical protein
MVSRKSIGTEVWIYLLIRNRRSKLSHPPLVHPQLQFIIHMHTSVDGEQLLSQLFRCVPDRQWLFRYGRVPVHFILATRMWEVCITLSCKTQLQNNINRDSLHRKERVHDANCPSSAKVPQTSKNAWHLKPCNRIRITSTQTLYSAPRPAKKTLADWIPDEWERLMSQSLLCHYRTR